MKKLFSILVIAFILCMNTNAQTAVTHPFSLLDSALFSVKPYYNSPLSFYMQPDSTCLALGYSNSNYPVADTVRFARQRRLWIYVANSHPEASITVVVHKDSTGTVNACKVYLEASNDGINWVRQNDTLTTTNVTNISHTWILPAPITFVTAAAPNYNNYKYPYLPYLYYEVLFVGVSTSKVDIHAYFVPRHNSTAPN